MKAVKLRNKSAHTVVVSSLKNLDGFPLMIQPGGWTVVSEETFKHADLQAHLGATLFEETKLVVRTKSLPPPPSPPPQVELPPSIESAVERYSSDLKAEYLKAPGITEGNIDKVLARFPSKIALAHASKEELRDCGVTKSYVSRLKEWSREPTIQMEETKFVRSIEP